LSSSLSITVYSTQAQTAGERNLTYWSDVGSWHNCQSAACYQQSIIKLKSCSSRNHSFV